MKIDIIFGKIFADLFLVVVELVANLVENFEILDSDHEFWGNDGARCSSEHLKCADENHID